MLIHKHKFQETRESVKEFMKNNQKNGTKPIPIIVIVAVALVVLLAIGGTGFFIFKDDISSKIKTLTCEHSYTKATCVSLKTCKLCGKEEGETIPHRWTKATCKQAAHCLECNTQKGEPLEHTWIEATCTSPKTCSKCRTEDGEPLPHTYGDATHSTPEKCTVCEHEHCTVIEDISYTEGEKEKLDKWTVAPNVFDEKIENCAEFTFWYYAYTSGNFADGTSVPLKGDFRVYVKKSDGEWLHVKNISMTGSDGEFTLLFGYDTPIDIVAYEILPPESFSDSYNAHSTVSNAIVVE